MDSEAWRICVHEAGHAAVCTALGGRVDRVRRLDNLHGETIARIQYEAPLKNHVAYYMGGAAADHVFLGRPFDESPSDEDRQLTERLLRGAGAAERSVALRDGKALSLRLVRQHKAGILRLAEELSETSLLVGLKLKIRLQTFKQNEVKNEKTIRDFDELRRRRKQGYGSYESVARVGFKN